MNLTKIKGIAVRYSIATIGLIFVAIGVALSIKSNLGTAPVSCPPFVVSLWSASFTVGEFTMMMHGIFILLQLILLRKKFKLEYLMQIPAAIVFGFLTDGAIMLFSWINADTFTMRLILSVLTVLVTAIGVSLEVIGNAWMLAGEFMVSAISQVTGIKFRDAKIGFDIFLVAISGIFSYFVFNNFFGDSNNVVIGIGTVILAVFTGLVMRITDPLAQKLFGKIIENTYKNNG